MKKTLIKVVEDLEVWVDEYPNDCREYKLERTTRSGYYLVISSNQISYSVHNIDEHFDLGKVLIQLKEKQTQEDRAQFEKLKARFESKGAYL
jgi:RNA binding exosome subunit